VTHSYEVARVDTPSTSASIAGPATVMAVGAAVGLTVAYLYLTDSGRHVRRQIDPWLDQCLEEISRLRGAALKARRAWHEAAASVDVVRNLGQGSRERAW
jgi:hypothetical protein